MLPVCGDHVSSWSSCRSPNSAGLLFLFFPSAKIQKKDVTSIILPCHVLQNHIRVKGKRKLTNQGGGKCVVKDTIVGLEVPGNLLKLETLKCL